MTTKVKIYGITGKARSGKDLFASMLADALKPTDVCVFAFADAIKDMLAPVLSILTPPNHSPYTFIDECFDGPLKETPLPSIGHSPRQLLQWLGTEWGRQLVDEEMWIKLMQHRIDNDVADVMTYASTDQVPDQIIYLISDVRFDNEAQWLNGRVIQIIRPNTAEVAEHASENGIKDYHVITKVYNDGTVHDLEKQAARVAQEIRSGRI